MEIFCYECKKSGHLHGECPELQKKYKKEKFRKTKAMVATWSDEDSYTSSSSSDQKENLCLMAIEDNSCEVNFELESVSNEQWEEAYELLYEKFKNLK